MIGSRNQETTAAVALAPSAVAEAAAAAVAAAMSHSIVLAVRMAAVMMWTDFGMVL